VLLLGLAPRVAIADEVRSKWYGLTAGIAAELDGDRTVGAAISLSAGMDGHGTEGPAPLWSARGTLLGIITPRSKALLPILSGEIILRAGPARFSLLGGVEICGVARQAPYTVFSLFGLAGGAGVSFDVARMVRLVLRSQVIWLPDFARVRVAAPEDSTASLPKYLYITGLAGVEINL
jgi:hypothetical protein